MKKMMNKLLNKLYYLYIKRSKEEISWIIYEYVFEEENVKIKLKDRLKIKVFKLNKELKNYLILNYNLNFDFCANSSLGHVIFS